MKTIMMTITLLFGQIILAKHDNCIKLKKLKKKCLEGKTTRVNITCGGHWYRYWTDEYEMYLSKGEKDFSKDVVKGKCIQVKYETMSMDCYEFLDYKVPLFFCRKQKKEICARLKQDGFGDVIPKWRKRNKKQAYITKACSEVIN